MTMRTLLTTLAVFASILLASAQTVTGRWTTIDDNTGKAKSVVEITERNGKLSGRIVEIFDAAKRDKLCDKCPGDRTNKPVLGMEIIRDMAQSGQEWKAGTILDPENGKVYDCKIWVEDGKLQVRGYVAFFYRTQVWVRAKN